MPSVGEVVADVVVVGGGNAALCAALAAAQKLNLNGNKPDDTPNPDENHNHNNDGGVVLIEAAGEDETGGNSWFSDGAMRVAFDSFGALCNLLRLSDDEAGGVEVPVYSVADYLRDLKDAGGGREDLMGVLASQSFGTMEWMRDGGVALELIRDNQSHDIGGGRRRFFGNLNVRAVGRGIGLVDSLRDACVGAGVRIFYGMRARRLLMEDGRCVGVVADGVNSDHSPDHDDNLNPDDNHDHNHSPDRKGDALRACVWVPACAGMTVRGAVVLACGGFEGDAGMRGEFLGDCWRKAKVRGTRHNLGDGLRMALEVGAGRCGDWGGCHSVGTDFNSPPAGDFGLPGDIWKKHSYPYGVMVNRRGVRFVDEGADLRNYTYAKYGREVLQQPDAMAWQVFDAQSAPLLRTEYLHDRVAVCRADSLDALAVGMGLDGDDVVRFLHTIKEFNDACDSSAAGFDPAVRDGLKTVGLDIPKSNWALPVCRPPFLAFAITCGITFTFGGLSVDVCGRVLDSDGGVIDGLFAAGEMVGGLFGHNYPGGAGLMSGAVFGRVAGLSAVGG